MNPSRAPLGVGGVISTAFGLYGKRWAQLWLAVALIVVPAQLIVFAIVRGTLSSDAFARNGTIYTTGSTGPAVAAIAAFGFISAILAMGMLSRFLVETYTGHPTTLAESLRYVSRHLGSLIALAIVSGVAIAISFITIIGWVFLIVAWSVAVPALVFEGVGVFDALKRSWELVKGHWWATLGALVLGYLVIFALSFASGAIFGGATSSSSVTGVLILAALARSIGAILTYPFIAAVTVVLYVNLRVQKEHLDPAQLTQAAPAQTAGL